MRLAAVASLVLANAAQELPKPEKPPELSKDQKLLIRDAQLSYVQTMAEKTALESRLKDINAAVPVAQKQLEEVMKNASPPGYTAQPDLTLKKNPEPPPAPKAEAPAAPAPAK
jgi:hypothetical protein